MSSSSICIPRVESTISKEYIKTILSNLNIGIINRIIEIPLRNDNTHKRIIINLNWNKTQKSINMQKTLTKSGSIKLVYNNNEPWFWKIVNTNPQI